MPISLISWPNPYGLGAPLHLVPRTKYEHYASIAEVTTRARPNCLNMNLRQTPMLEQEFQRDGL